MPIRILNNGVSIPGHVIPFTDFPGWHNCHLRRVPNTLRLENDGSSLIQQGFPFSYLGDFIRGVCRWGGYAGIAGRVINNNTEQKIVNNFTNANNAFNNPQPAGSALQILNQLHSLGTPSFASKHLRFLRPDICPVFDSKLRDAFGYVFSPVGYQQMSKHSVDAGISITEQVGNVKSKAGNYFIDRPWGAADVEMSIFAYLNFNPC